MEIVSPTGNIVQCFRPIYYNKLPPGYFFTFCLNYNLTFFNSYTQVAVLMNLESNHTSLCLNSFNENVVYPFKIPIIKNISFKNYMVMPFQCASAGDICADQNGRLFLALGASENGIVYFDFLTRKTVSVHTRNFSNQKVAKMDNLNNVYVNAMGMKIYEYEENNFMSIQEEFPFKNSNLDVIP